MHEFVDYILCNMKIIPLFLSIMMVHQISEAQVEQKSASSSAVNSISMDAIPLSPEKLWQLGRVSADGVTNDGKYVLYSVSEYDLSKTTLSKKTYVQSLVTGEKKLFLGEGTSIIEVADNNDVYYLEKGQIWLKNLDTYNASQLTEGDISYQNVKIAPDRSHILYSQSVQIKDYHSPVRYKDLEKSNVFVYDDLDYRHWDSFNNGKFEHPFVAPLINGKVGKGIDLLEGEPFYSPQAPFGGSEDYTWSADSKSVLYVTKKKFGKEYALSTNTDIYRYDLANATTDNMTEGKMGYDTNPLFNKEGTRWSWLSMKTDGYEADKNDILVQDFKSSLVLNLTAHWDGTVNSYKWSKDGRKIFFTAPTKGTIQLFEVEVPTNFMVRSLPLIKQLSDGVFDITGIVGELTDGFVVTSTKMTRAQEVYVFDLKKNDLIPVSTANDAQYAQIYENKVESRITKASDGLDLFSWVIYPPNFDPSKKYPTLLYCQGGPQSALTQFYSLRWNLQLIASQGYIVIAPNRRGMPGWGEKWNADISQDWGGQPIRDYLSAIDDLAQESYVDKDRLGAIGASYGGYSVFMLAGVHENRFKSYISHCGLFDMTSWYGTTEELFFANHDTGGAYWENPDHPSYNEFNPIKHIDKWNTPILIFQGGKDYRVPIGQGLEAFQAAQLKDIKSRLVYLPDENHWVLQGQNAMVWQREFFKWLEETL